MKTCSTSLGIRELQMKGIWITKILVYKSIRMATKPTRTNAGQYVEQRISHTFLVGIAKLCSPFENYLTI